jgi:hypothetical protein
MEMSEFPYDHKKYSNVLKSNPNAEIVLALTSRGNVDLEHGEPKFLGPRDIVVESEEELFKLHELRKDKKYASELTLKKRKSINGLSSAVKALEESRRIGLSEYFNYFGIKLYSCDITLDGAYLEIWGKTKAEYEKSQEEEIAAEIEAELKKVNAKKPDWLKRGEELIYPEKIDKWYKFVEEAILDEITPGYRVEEMLDMMERLARGESFEELYKIIEQDTTSKYKYLGWPLCDLAMNVPEFYEYILNKEHEKYSAKNYSWYKNHIEYIKAENKMLALLNPDFLEKFKDESKVIDEHTEPSVQENPVNEATGNKASEKTIQVISPSEEKITESTLVSTLDEATLENQSDKSTRVEAEKALVANVKKKNKLISMIEFAQKKLNELRAKIANKSNDDKTK